MVRQTGTGYLLIDTVANGAPPLTSTITGGTSGATGTVSTATSRAWTEIVYDTPGTSHIDKRVALLNTGDSGSEQVWITLEQYTNVLVAGITFNGALSYNGLIGGWNGLQLVDPNVEHCMSMPNTGNPTRDGLKYWLVADRKRIILAVHMEYLLGGGESQWAHTGFLERWDPPANIRSRTVLAVPSAGMVVYSSGGSSLGYGGAVIIGSISGLLTLDVLSVEPPIPNPDGSHAALPMWASSNDGYCGNIDGLYYTDPTVGLGDTFTIGAATFVCLQGTTRATMLPSNSGELDVSDWIDIFIGGRPGRLWLRSWEACRAGPSMPSATGPAILPSAKSSSTMLPAISRSRRTWITGPEPTTNPSMRGDPRAIRPAVMPTRSRASPPPPAP